MTISNECSSRLFPSDGTVRLRRFYTSEVADEIARQQHFVPLLEHFEPSDYPSKMNVLEKLRSMKCGGDLALNNVTENEKKVVAVGIVDPLVRRTLSLYTSVYKVRPCLQFLQKRVDV